METDPVLTTGTPRWVKVFAVVALVLVLAFLILTLSGRGHGPGRHTADQLPPSSVGEQQA